MLHKNIAMGLVGEFADQQGLRSEDVVFSAELTLASSDSSKYSIEMAIELLVGISSRCGRSLLKFATMHFVSSPITPRPFFEGLLQTIRNVGVAPGLRWFLVFVLSGLYWLAVSLAALGELC